MTPTGTVDVLHVEDLEADAELTRRVLGKMDELSDIRWVADGQEALDYLFARGPYAGRNMHHTPKLILLDLGLPKVRGTAVLEALRQHPVTASIPVVVMTSSEDPNDAKAAYERGANSVVIKPMDYAEFSSLVDCLGRYWLRINEYV